MNLHTKADELENFFLIEQFLHLPQFVRIGEIRVKCLSFVKVEIPVALVSLAVSDGRALPVFVDLPLGRMLQNALHELHEFTLIPQSTIRFHSKESPPKLTNRPRRSFEAAR